MDPQSAPIRRPGLANLGNTCFMNATLQALLSAAPLRRHFLDPVAPPAPGAPAGKEGALTANFRRFVVAVSAEAAAGAGAAPAPAPAAADAALPPPQQLPQPPQPRRVVRPSDLHASITKAAPRFRGFRQHDAQDLFQGLVNGMDDEEAARFRTALLHAPRAAAEPAVSGVTAAAGDSSPLHDGSDNVAAAAATADANSADTAAAVGADADASMSALTCAANELAGEKGGDSSAIESLPRPAPDSAVEYASDNAEQDGARACSDASAEVEEVKVTTALPGTLNNSSSPLAALASGSTPSPPPPLPTTFVGRIFGGVSVSVVCCLACSYTGVREEQYIDISLPLSADTERHALASAASAASFAAAERAVSAKSSKIAMQRELLQREREREREKKDRKGKGGAAARSKGAAAAAVSSWGPPSADKPQEVDLSTVDVGLVEAGLSPSLLDSVARTTDERLDAMPRKELLEWMAANGSAAFLKSVNSMWKRSSTFASAPKSVQGEVLKKLVKHAARLRNAAIGLQQRRATAAAAGGAQPSVAAVESAAASSTQVPAPPPPPPPSCPPAHSEPQLPDSAADCANPGSPQFPHPAGLPEAAVESGFEDVNASQEAEPHGAENLAPSDAGAALSESAPCPPIESAAPPTLSSNTLPGDDTEAMFRASSMRSVAGRYLLPPPLSAAWTQADSPEGKLQEARFGATAARARNVSNSLEALIAAFTAPEMLRTSTQNGYQCPRCNDAAKERNKALDAAKAAPAPSVALGADVAAELAAAPPAEPPVGVAESSAETLPVGGGAGSSPLEPLVSAPSPTAPLPTAGKTGVKAGFTAAVVSEPQTPAAAAQVESEKVLCDATKRTLLTPVLPSVLTLHLKRFKQIFPGNSARISGAVAGYGGASLIKISAPVDVPEVLDVSPFMATYAPDCSGDGAGEDAAAKEGAAGDLPEGSSSAGGDAPVPSTVYRLIAIIVHSGSLGGGHYFSYVRNGKSGNWLCCNDSSVSSVSLDEALRSEAYIAMYSRE